MMYDVCMYVCMMYDVKGFLSRDDPRTIRRRIISVTVMALFAPLSLLPFADYREVCVCVCVMYDV